MDSGLHIRKISPKRGNSQRQIEGVAAILRVGEKSLDHAYLDVWIGELKLGGEWDGARRVAGLSSDVE